MIVQRDRVAHRYRGRIEDKEASQRGSHWRPQHKQVFAPTIEFSVGRVLTDCDRPQDG